MPRNILIIDDQEDMLLILDREFRKVGWATIFTSSKFEGALDLIVAKKIDLVISDVRIGRDSGFDLVQSIRNDHPNVGTILMSAYRSPSNRQQAMDLGVLVFLEKPFQISKMITEVEKFFHLRERPAPVPQPEPASSADKDSGVLVHFKLQDLVQLFCLNGKNVLITVASGGKAPQGEIYIQRGKVIHAEFADKTGEAAFNALMQISEPLLKVNDWAAPVPVTISTGWEHLLLMAAVNIDHQEDEGMSAAST